MESDTNPTGSVVCLDSQTLLAVKELRIPTVCLSSDKLKKRSMRRNSDVKMPTSSNSSQGASPVRAQKEERP